MADVICISDTVQEFLGERYYLCGYYFQHNGKRLHRAVWEYHNGKIPKGYHVHHKDHNRLNNSPDNLELLEKTEHLREHMEDESRKEQGRKSIVFAIEAAKEWHHSEEGRKWHSEHAKEVAKNLKPITWNCSYCGKEFQTMSQIKSGNHFCHPNCKAAFRRRRVRNESIQD